MAAALLSLGAGPKDKLRIELEKVAPVFPVEPAWMMTLDSPPSAAGVMDADQVYIPLQSSWVVALARETGAVRWTARFDTRWPPLRVANLVVIASDDALHALDAATGLEQWMVPFNGPAAPLGASVDRVFAVSKRGELVVLRTVDGGEIWRRPPAAPAVHAPIAIGDLVVVVVEGSGVLAVRGEDGDLVWTRTLEGALSAPVAAKDRIFIGSTANVLHALDPRRGVDLWRFLVGGDVIGAAVDGDVVYFASLDNILRAVNRGNGNQRWKTVIPTRPAAAPIAFDGVVVLTGVAPRVDGYDGRTGAAQGSYTASGDLQGQALIDKLLPYRVAMVTITRDGRVAGMRSSPMMMRDPAASSWTALPGRRLGRETAPNPES